MNFRKLFDFLRDLNSEGNNNKAWMDEHRKQYETIRDEYKEFLSDLNLSLAKIHPDYHDTPGKKAINRINNNLVFHPNKPTYKDHFGAGMDQAKNYADFYIHLGINECFLAGGFYHSPNDILKKIRAAIDYNGNEFKKIISAKEFNDYYGELMSDDALTNAPKGYSIDHPHIELLKLRSFVVMHPLTQKEVISDDFKEELIKAYRILLPFRNYLNQAVAFEE
ncbi:TIGR02453 family protein [Marivirga lumbricoides]